MTFFYFVHFKMSHNPSEITVNADMMLKNHFLLLAQLKSCAAKYFSETLIHFFTDSKLQTNDVRTNLAFS